jgi:ribose transport system permease protein
MRSSQVAKKAWNYLGPQQVSAIYVLIAICIVFTIWVPPSFPTIATVRQVLNSGAITGIAATGLVLPLCVGVFDVSIVYVMTLSGVLSAELVANHGVSIPLAILASLGAGLAVGIVNSIIVVGLRISSFIGTLSMGLIVQAIVTMISNGNTITGVQLTGSFGNIAGDGIDNITYPVFIWLALILIVWIFLDFSIAGRRMYAVGFSPEASRLATIRVKRYQVCALLGSSLMGAAAGIILASQIESGDPSSGNSYLLPCYAAVFLGATQFRGGRFNAWGTALATVLVGTGTVGLGLANTQQWAQSLFSGVILLGALAIFENRRTRSRPWWPRTTRTVQPPPDVDDGPERVISETLDISKD